MNAYSRAVTPLAMVAVTCLLVACAPQPTMQAGPDAEVTFDGLVRIDNSRMQRAWVKPGIDLSSYTKILPVGAEIQYRSVGHGSGATAARSGQSEFPMTDEQKKRLATNVSAVFIDELSKSRFYELTEAPGPDVLLVHGQLLDVVSRTPPQRVGRGNTFVNSFGEATLVLEIFDSQSGEILARGIDRRAAQPAGTTMRMSSSATATAEVRRLARRWATMLREGLDQFHES